jgi:hypothetical protein
MSVTHQDTSQARAVSSKLWLLETSQMSGLRGIQEFLTNAR